MLELLFRSHESIRAQALCNMTCTLPTFRRSTLPPSSGYSVMNKLKMKAARYFVKSVSFPKTTGFHNAEDYYKNFYGTWSFPNISQKSVQKGVQFLNVCKLHVTLFKLQEINIQIYKDTCFGLSRSTVSSFGPLSYKHSGSTAGVLRSHQYTKLSQHSLVYLASGLSPNMLFSTSITSANVGVGWIS